MSTAIVKFLTRAALCLLLTATLAAAAPPLIQVKARVEGSDASVQELLGMTTPRKTWTFRRPKNVLTHPPVTLRSGQLGRTEIIREVPTSAKAGPTENAGLLLDVRAVVRGGRVELTGKSIVRRFAARTTTGSVHAVTFVTRESSFDATVSSGEALTIPIGNGPRDKTQLVLEATIVDTSGRPVSHQERM